MTREIGEVLSLIPLVPRPPEADDLVGATTEQLRSLTERLSFELPPSLEEWLSHCNGVMAGTGGLYGAGHPRGLLRIEAILDMYPRWPALQWIPVAGDGHGNAYVIDCSRTLMGADVVLFIDVAEREDEPAYIVASSLGRFLVSLLNKELGEGRWPFDSAFVGEHDPELLRAPAALLPWNA